ncbi:NUMOD4 motif-containing HNH endonuclease [Streptomyces sp. H34-S4]|uniref:NUMOD4 motif-containing HNH endonuclease n=1 Tax=Streptomyces sp. H34-S4 TaxID=2996463 RepID=UPI00226D6340|nr:NUMOD4 motif-containing HNH endonuclease [Streptomyces sp. H34-S4]MCY0933612.1 NUMOD4 motif-containing HNH endonuclease [Streptomyces sp. H34-S4]
MEETWKDIPDCAGMYEVSNLGRVRSWHVWGSNQGRRASEPRLLSLCADRDGYPSVTLTGKARGRTLRVHILVAEAFIGPRPKSMVVCHNDGSSQNNTASNLRYGTPAENDSDKDLHGTRFVPSPESVSGELNGSAKLTEEQVRYCRQVYIKRDREFGARALARTFGVSQRSMSDAINGKTWKVVA